MNNILRIRTLTDRFFDGETSLSEEQELYAFFSQATGPAALPEDLRPLRQMFLDMQAVAAPVPSVAIPSQQTQPLQQTRRRWLVAAAVAVLAVGGALQLFHRSPSSVPAEEGEYVAYIYGQRTTDHNIVMDEMQKTMTAMACDGSDVVEEQLKAMFDNE